MYLVLHLHFSYLPFFSLSFVYSYSLTTPLSPRFRYPFSLFYPYFLALFPSFCSLSLCTPSLLTHVSPFTIYPFSPLSPHLFVTLQPLLSPFILPILSPLRPFSSHISIRLSSFPPPLHYPLWPSFTPLPSLHLSIPPFLALNPRP